VEGGDMAFKRELVEAWVASQAPGERLLGSIAAGTWTPMQVTATYGGSGWTSGMRADDVQFKGDDVMSRRIAEFGADPSKSVAPFASTTFYVLTDRRLLLGSRSSVRNRPKDLLHAAPADLVAVYWFDIRETGGNVFRHLLVDFGDGFWRRDRTGLAVLGKRLATTDDADAFFAALGPRAREIPAAL